MGVMMLVMVLGLVFAFPMPMHGGMTAHGPDADQNRTHAAASGPDRDNHAGESDMHRDPAVQPEQK